MSLLRVLSVDDEALALRRLEILLSAIPNVEQVGQARGVRDAITKIDELVPDVVLLDIKMRDGNGFDLIEALAGRSNAPVVVFVTAFDRFAVRAFETSAIAYLLKPIERDRLALALQKARHRISEIDSEQRIAELREIISSLRSEADENSHFESDFWLKSSCGLVKVPADSIECVGSEDEYVRLHATSGSYLMRGSIRQLQKRLDPEQFVRIHRRWLVRKAAIAQLQTSSFGGTAVLLNSGMRLLAGRVYGKQLRDLLPASTRTERDLRG
jgi:two-component system LytT family response regulator